MHRFLPLTGTPGSVRRPAWSASTLHGVFGLLGTIVLLAWQLAAAGPALAAAGELDPSFGHNGMVTTDFADSNDQAKALVIQADDKLVAAGSTSQPHLPNSSPTDFGLTRYTRNGSLDTGFGTGGKVTTDFFGYGDTLSALVIQADGKLVAAGRAATSNGSGDFALARYRPDGTLDPTFGTAGRVTTNFLGNDGASALAMQADGKLVAAGYTSDSSGAGNIVLARYQPDGTLDPSFGTAGTAIGATSVGALVVQTDGKLVTAGSTGGSYADFALTRYQPDGTLDPSFGTAGTVTTDFAGQYDAANALIVQTDAKLVAAGMAGADFALARYQPDGTLDPSFGTAGTVTTHFAGRNAAANALVAQSGLLVAAGSVTVESSLYGMDFALARYHPDGTLDPSFGTAGTVTTDITGNSLYGYARDQATALAVQHNGKLVAAGTASTNAKVGINDFALVRYRSD